jgi:hypothetical protein
MSVMVLWIVTLRVLVGCSQSFKESIASIFTSNLKIEAPRSSQTSITFHKTTRCHNPENHNRYYYSFTTFGRIYIQGSSYLYRLTISNSKVD